MNVSKVLFLKYYFCITKEAASKTYSEVIVKESIYYTILFALLLNCWMVSIHIPLKIAILSVNYHLKLDVFTVLFGTKILVS